MSAGNEITVTVVDGPSVGVAVAAAVGDALYITDGATASVSVTSVGDRGPKGDLGPANVLTVGTVATGESGSSAVVTITGTAPSQVISFTIPRGDSGQVGATGPANTLSIGTVTTGSPGSSASASISGTPPSQSLSLSIPRGDVGPAGPQGTFADAQAIVSTAANRTLQLSDAGKLIAVDNPSETITITVPAESSVNFPTGTHIDIVRLGVGAVVVAAASGVTANSTPGLNLRARYSSATLIKVGTNSWVVVGDLAA